MELENPTTTDILKEIAQGELVLAFLYNEDGEPEVWYIWEDTYENILYEVENELQDSWTEGTLGTHYETAKFLDKFLAGDQGRTDIRVYIKLQGKK